MLSEKLMEALESIQNSVQLSMEEKLSFAYIDNHHISCGCEGDIDYCSGGAFSELTYITLAEPR